MLYTGRWHEAIIQLDTTQQAIVVRKLLAKTPNSEPTRVNQDALGNSCWIGVQADNEIVGALASQPAYGRRGQPTTPAAVVRIALWVAPQWRNRGIAQAMMQRCITVNRHAGVRHLVIDGVESDEGLRKLLRQFAVELIFTHTDCQAWLELNSDAALV